MGYNGLSRLSEIRQMIPLPFKANTGPREGLLPSQLQPETRNQARAQSPVPEQSATKCSEL